MVSEWRLIPRKTNHMIRELELSSGLNFERKEKLDIELNHMIQ